MILMLLLASVVTTADGPQLTPTETRMVASINKYREKNDLPPLTPDPILMKVARQRCPAFSHCIGGKWMWHACHEAGFRGWATDDIASGYETPEDAVHGWETSDGHARQMRGFFNMNGRWQDYHFDRVGVARSGNKWIAVFGQGNDGKR